MFVMEIFLITFPLKSTKFNERMNKHEPNHNVYNVCCVFRYSAFKAVVVAFICTFFQALNVPVFWPILVMYFIILFTITMKRQIKVSNVGPSSVCAWGRGGGVLL